MSGMRWMYVVMIGFFSLGLVLATGCAKKEAGEAAATQQTEEQGAKVRAGEPEEDELEVELPEAVEQAIEANVPGAEIESIEAAEESGITLYDIEFKDDRGEIEVTADGTVMDVVTIITMEDLPAAAAQAIRAAAEGSTIQRLEESEIRYEIKMEGETGVIVNLDAPRYVYEAELVKGDRKGEITVDAAGNIIEPLKWEGD